MQFNQNGPNVEVQVFAKHLNKKRERVTVEIQETSLRVEIKTDDLSQVEYLLEEDLYQSIDVDSSKWDVWATQVNIKLRKGDPSIVWPSLAHTDTPVCVLNESGSSVCHASVPMQTTMNAVNKDSRYMCRQCKVGHLLWM